MAHLTRRSIRLIKKPLHVGIIGVPLAHGQPLGGVDFGPDVMRRRGLQKMIENVTTHDGQKWIVEDLKNINVNPALIGSPSDYPNCKNNMNLGAINKMLAQKVSSVRQKDRFALSIGGDHSCGIGTVSGVLDAHPETGVIWVDAHADINTPKTSASGNVHGMPVAFLMNIDNSRDIPGFQWMKSVPILKPYRLVYVGLRDIDDGERNFIKQLGIKAFTMVEIDKFGIASVMEQAMDHLSNRTQRPIHLSFDIDSVDPLYARATGTRVRGGLSYREAFYLVEAVSETGLLCSMDLVEVNPILGNESDVGDTIDLATGLICSGLGSVIL